MFHINGTIFINIDRLYLHTCHLSTSWICTMCWCRYKTKLKKKNKCHFIWQSGKIYQSFEQMSLSDWSKLCKIKKIVLMKKKKLNKRLRGLSLYLGKEIIYVLFWRVFFIHHSKQSLVYWPCGFWGEYIFLIWLIIKKKCLQQRWWSQSLLRLFSMMFWGNQIIVY